MGKEVHWRCFQQLPTSSFADEAFGQLVEPLLFLNPEFEALLLRAALIQGIFNRSELGLQSLEKGQIDGASAPAARRDGPI